ncbi:dephospho-CoA kinase [Aequorivita sp. Q41]|uniref:dephospho-CoA kinase n=1 Tax=Aequorivita sp. Q41 TaxID=3153300 RepID=UPI003242733A
MKIIGLTGGIGSGKTTVAKMFSRLGVPVYIADDEAKKLMATSKVIRKELIALLGEEAYMENSVNRKFIASKIFKDKVLLEAVNAIIHPKVAAHFKEWTTKQKSNYVIKEAAILFENGSYKNCDLVILVTAPEDIRVARVMARDKTSAKEIETRMNNQWSDEKKRQLADLVIENIDLENTKARVEFIDRSLKIEAD